MLRAQGDTKFAQVLREEAPPGRTDAPLCGQVAPRCDQVGARAGPRSPTCEACGAYRRISLCRRPSLPPLRIAWFLDCGGYLEARADPSGPHIKVVTGTWGVRGAPKSSVFGNGPKTSACSYKLSHLSSKSATKEAKRPSVLAC